MLSELTKVIQTAHESYMSVDHSPGGVTEFEYIAKSVLQNLASQTDEEALLTPEEIFKVLDQPHPDDIVDAFKENCKGIAKAQAAKCALRYRARCEQAKEQARQEAYQQAIELLSCQLDSKDIAITDLKSLLEMAKDKLQEERDQKSDIRREVIEQARVEERNAIFEKIKCENPSMWEKYKDYWEALFHGKRERKRNDHT